MKKILTFVGLSIIFIATVVAEETKEEPKKETATEIAKKADTTTMKDSTTVKEAAWTTNKSGLKWRDKIVGQGTAATMHMDVNCHYTVCLTDSSGNKGKLIQTSKGSTPLQCTLGINLIQGWSEGMVGMKEGGTRELIVPPHIGYGERGGGGGMIPPNATLFFEIEFLNQIKK